MNKIKSLILIISIILIAACGNGPPPEIGFDGNVFSHISTKASSGNKFDISTYQSTTNENLILITPYESTDLDRFSDIYTNTFKAQGFKFNSKGNKHLGVSASQIVYLSTSPNLKSLSILMVTKVAGKTPSIKESLDVFKKLNELI